MRELMPHQERALAYLLQNRGGALFMQMRLGKTLVAIRYAQVSHAILPKILVVAPVEGLWAWQRELAMEECHFQVLHGLPKKDRVYPEFKRAGWILINYESLLTTPELLNYEWDLVILDESRRIANPKSQTTKLLRSYTWKSERIVLSGEPAPESPLEYYEQFRFVHGSFMRCKNYWEFRNRYFRELAPHEWVPKNSLLQVLKDEIREAGFFLSRKDAGIPDKKIYETRTVELPKPIRRVYDSVLHDFLVELEGKIVKETKWVPVQYLWLHQIASGWLGLEEIWDGKVKELLRLLQGELSKESVVVWFRFNPAISHVVLALRKAGISCARITGEETREDRERAIDRFRNGSVRVLLCQVKCGKTAIDLSSSSTAIYFTNSYSLEERHQSEDRILNPKKREPLLYLDLVTERTVEEDILDVLRQKGNEAKFYMSDLLNKLKAGAAC